MAIAVTVGSGAAVAAAATSHPAGTVAISHLSDASPVLAPGGSFSSLYDVANTTGRTQAVSVSITALARPSSYLEVSVERCAVAWTDSRSGFRCASGASTAVTERRLSDIHAPVTIAVDRATTGHFRARVELAVGTPNSLQGTPLGLGMTWSTVERV